MGNLITTYSSVTEFADNCANEYSAILNRAYEFLSRMEKLYYEVQADLEKISQQIMRGYRMRDEIQLKVDKYQALMEEAAAEVERCQAQIDYVLSHPIIRTYTDDDGNSYTVEEIDEAALAAAERARDEAQAIYEMYREKYNEAKAVKYEVDATVSRFETIKKGIEAVAQAIQNDIYETKKYIDAIANEAEYNTQTLQGVLGSIAAYLASKAIYMPAGTNYADYSGNAGGSTSSSLSDGFLGLFGKKKIEKKYTTKSASAGVTKEEYKQYKHFYSLVDELDISQDYKDVIINNFANMNKDIKQVYNIYAKKLKCLDVNCVDDEGNPNGYFSQLEGGFKVNQADDLENPLGMGNTFFHESGHMLDSLIGKGSDSGYYASYSGYMTESAHEDYYDAIKNIMNSEKCDEATAQKKLTTELKKHPIASNVVSDVFGGITYNKVHGRWGHWGDYWEKRGRDAIGKEAFAEITADIACNNTESIKFTQKYLPKTMQRYNDIIQGVIK